MFQRDYLAEITASLIEATNDQICANTTRSGDWKVHYPWFPDEEGNGDGLSTARMMTPWTCRAWTPCSDTSKRRVTRRGIPPKSSPLYRETLCGRL